MHSSALLGPPAVLVLWSLVILIWMVITRFSAFAREGIALTTAPKGIRYADVESRMPARVNWISHNHTHLMEQPTIFYAVIAVLAIAGDNSSVNLTLAWSYVGLRIVHSLWQTLVNVVIVRVTLFALSTFCLLGLAINAVRITVL